MPGKVEAESLAMQIISSISAVASMTAVVMYLRFPHLQKKSYFTLQYYVAVSNVLTSIGSAIGVVQTGTVACWFQGILTNIFTLSSIQWTTVMAFSLFSIVHYDKQLNVTPLVHAYCWIPPIVATLLPLINSTYGNVGNWCWVVSKSSTPPWGEMVWFWFSYYGWVWLGIFLMLGILAEMHYTIQQRHSTTTVKHLRKIISTLNLFPIIILIAWGPACASDTIWEMFDRYNGVFGVIATMFACSQGLLTAILFWIRNKEVQKLAPYFFKSNAPIHTERDLRQKNSSNIEEILDRSQLPSSSWSSLSEQVAQQLTSLRTKMKIDVSLRTGTETNSTNNNNIAIAASTSVSKLLNPSECRSTISVPRSTHTVHSPTPVEENRSYDVVQEFHPKEKKESVLPHLESDPMDII